jgi:predicted AAA+ superfamily ATPase
MSGAQRRTSIGPHPILGALFESLVTLNVQAYAPHAEAKVHHLRDRDGRHEIDLIVTGLGGRVLALEVKLAAVPDDRDVQHLLWLRSQLGEQLVDAAIVTTGTHAYRREDGIAVVPAALLGP